MKRFNPPPVAEMRHAIMCKLYAQTDKLAYLARDEVTRRAEACHLYFHLRFNMLELHKDLPRTLELAMGL